ncbi:MAG: GNAT family N-acetyltransferase [Desulfobacteraceae bacterium]|nr:GNAT family N-acetyltransferase [Desulfobacteraceae bacterium]
MKRDENPAFSVSPLTRRDIGEISRRLAAMDPWLTLEYKPETLAFYLLQADSALQRHVVTVGNSLAGILAVRHPWLFGPFIELLALFDGFRGQGIGSGLIAWTCGRFASRNVWVTVSSFNLRAQEFYDKAGFRKTAVLDDLIRPGWDEILLRKRPLKEDGDAERGRG